MSLRWRILASSVFVVILTAALTIGVAYWNAQRRLTQFTESISQDEAEFIAQFLSQEYTQFGGWNTLEDALISTGYIYDEQSFIEIYELTPEELSEFDPEELEEFVFAAPSRVFIINNEDELLLDSEYELEIGSIQTNLSGESQQIVDLRTRQPVGTVFVQFNSDFLIEESSAFLSDTLLTVSIGGGIAVLVVSLLAAWFAQRLTAPISALTDAIRTISERGDAQLLPVESADELGQMSMAFNSMTIGLQTQRDLRKRLIDDVSHELNTPLSVIQLEAKGLQDGMQTPEEAADQIIQEVDMLRNLVHDLNWLAETDSGELRLNLEPCDFGRLLATEVERWQTQAQAQQIELTLQTFPKLPEMQLDTMRISQVLGNIFRNALQHTEANDQINVDVTFGTAAGTKGSCAVITVTDNGVGIDPTELPHIFNRFYRADKSRSRVTGGRGLGLAISKAIVEAHKGSILVTSNGIDQGTTVRIELPFEHSRVDAVTVEH